MEVQVFELFADLAKIYMENKMKKQEKNFMYADTDSFRDTMNDCIGWQLGRIIEAMANTIPESLDDCFGTDIPEKIFNMPFEKANEIFKKWLKKRHITKPCLYYDDLYLIIGYKYGFYVITDGKTNLLVRENDNDLIILDVQEGEEDD